jgi:molecular chaperone DnaK (HSP70)
MGFPWGIDFGNANCVMAGQLPKRQKIIFAMTDCDVEN